MVKNKCLGLPNEFLTVSLQNPTITKCIAKKIQCLLAEVPTSV